MPTPSPLSLATKSIPATVDHSAPDGSLIRELLALRGGGLAHCTLPSGCVSQAVVHKTVEEIWYCVSGMGQVWRKLGDVEQIVDFIPGVCLTIPLGAHFQFRNTDAAPLCFLIATMPPWPSAGEAEQVPGHWPLDDTA
jgi:mannose-6-phosphate isomerase-like protein (cupin superfamily)